MVRQFKLHNTKTGAVYDLNVKGHFLNAPSGLGYGETTEFYRYGLFFNSSKSTVEQTSIKGDIIFSNPNAYAAYDEFFKGNIHTNLKLEYITPNQTCYKDVRIESIGKGEINPNTHALTCEVVFVSLSPFYKETDYSLNYLPDYEPQQWFLENPIFNNSNFDSTIKIAINFKKQTTTAKVPAGRIKYTVQNKPNTSRIFNTVYSGEFIDEVIPNYEIKKIDISNINNRFSIKKTSTTQVEYFLEPIIETDLTLRLVNDNIYRGISSALLFKPGQNDLFIEYTAENYAEIENIILTVREVVG